MQKIQRCTRVWGTHSEPPPRPGLVDPGEPDLEHRFKWMGASLGRFREGLQPASWPEQLPTEQLRHDGRCEANTEQSQLDAKTFEVEAADGHTYQDESDPLQHGVITREEDVGRKRRR